MLEKRDAGCRYGGDRNRWCLGLRCGQCAPARRNGRQGKAAEFIPVIDLAPSFSSDQAARSAVAWEIHKACRETGFFYIKNHGVSEALCDNILEMARAYFALSIEEKLEIDVRLSNCTRGYEPAGAQTLDEGSPADLKEGFVIGCDLDETHPYVKNGVPNCGANQWPRNPPGFRDLY